jgi:hypothetical protein
VSHAMCRVEVPRNRGDAQFGFEWSGSIEAPCARMSALPVLTGRFGADAMSEMGRVPPVRRRYAVDGSTLGQRRPFGTRIAVPNLDAVPPKACQGRGREFDMSRSFGSSK